MIFDLNSSTGWLKDDARLQTTRIRTIQVTDGTMAVPAFNQADRSEGTLATTANRAIGVQQMGGSGGTLMNSHQITLTKGFYLGKYEVRSNRLSVG